MPASLEVRSKVRTMTKRKDPTLTVRLTTDVVETARIVAAYRGEEMTRMLSDILRPVLAKMEAAEVSRRAAGGSPTIARRKRGNQ